MSVGKRETINHPSPKRIHRREGGGIKGMKKKPATIRAVKMSVGTKKGCKISVLL